jgi:[ribosomal protein S5]-alanine N-acetyltransferase
MGKSKGITMNASFLTGQRVYLRALNEMDADGVYVSWLNNPKVCLHNAHHYYPYTKNMALEYIRALAKDRSKLVLAVCLNQSNRHIGNISLQGINQISRSAEFAILMGEMDCWGQGYAKEAANMIVEHGFSQLNLNRIYCGTSIENEGMKRLATFLRMKEEGLRREAFFKGNRFMDLVEYGVLRKEFFERKGVK